jgi:hypothetical protein
LFFLSSATGSLIQSSSRYNTPVLYSRKCRIESLDDTTNSEQKKPKTGAEKTFAILEKILVVQNIPKKNTIEQAIGLLDKEYYYYLTSAHFLDATEALEDIKKVSTFFNIRSSEVSNSWLQYNIYISFIDK